MSITTELQWEFNSSGYQLLNVPTISDEEAPAITATADGNGFLAAWNNHISSDSVRARLADIHGVPTGGETDPSVGSAVFATDPALATLHNGNYVAAYTDNDPNHVGVVVRQLDANGQLLGPETLLHIGNPSGGDYDPDIAVLADGRFAVTWTHWLNSADTDIRFALFNEDGSLALNNGVVNTAFDLAEMSSVTALANGGFVAAWQSHTVGNHAVDFRIYDAGAQAIDGTDAQGVLIDNVGDNTDIQLAALPDGGFVVAYTDTGWGLSGTEITARVYNADGTARTGNILVNNGSTVGNQDHPSLTVLSNGYFAVSWNSSVTDNHIAAFDANGNAMTPARPLATNALEGEIAGLKDGFLGHVFVSTDPDAAGSHAIHGDVFLLTRTMTGDDDFNTLTGDALRDILHGGGSADSLEGRGGSDVLDGGDGFDTAMYFNAPTGVIASLVDPSKNTGDAKGDYYFSIEELYGSQFADTLEGDGGNNTISGDGGKDTLIGNGGDDVFYGGAGDDTVYGNDGNDTLNDIQGSDLMYGGAGDDTYNNYGNGTVIELPGEGHDTVYVDFTGYMLPDNVEDLYLEVTSSATSGYGNDLDNVITGNQNANLIEGRGGNDTLSGGASDDTLNGGDGDDTAVYFQSIDKFVLTDLGTKITVNSPTPLEGNDTLFSIEHLQFADGTIDVVDGNPLFDTVYYMSHNLDVFHAHVNALDHFNASGWHEGRDPNAFFSVNQYFNANPDVKASGMNPLDHYDQIGWHQGLDPSANFDTKLYLVHNPDVAAAGIDPLAHFLQQGMAEGRQAYAAIGTAVNGFDAEYYLLHNPDVAAAGIDPLTHYNQSGWHEGRNPNAWFDTNGYLAHYGDVAAAGINPLQHYEQNGWQEGRDPSAGFDTLGYLAANPDVAAAHVNPLDHFINSGIYEGRVAINDGVFH